MAIQLNLHDFTLSLIRCIHCKGKLEVEPFYQNHEIVEGFLHCRECQKHYPVIEGIPVLWRDFEQYLQARAGLGGELYLKCQHSKMKQFIKNSLSQLKPSGVDLSLLERRWVEIYKNSRRSRFYSIVRSCLKDLSFRNSLEHGSSIGLCSFVAEETRASLGIDKSFYAIREAKRAQRKNLDYLVADSLDHPFGCQKFDLVIGLNLLEVIEPKPFLETLFKQARQYAVVSDPYDFERGKDSVKDPLYASQVRKMFYAHQFRLIRGTSKPSYLPWNLVLNPRTRLGYRVDLIIGKKIR